MKKVSESRQRAVRDKIYSNGIASYGYLTPVDIYIAIVYLGLVPCDDNKQDVIDHVKDKMKKGVSNPSWFYFSNSI